MKKILYIHHSGNLGGAPKSLFLILKELNLKLYNAKIICISKGPVQDLFSELNIPVIINESIFPFHGSTVVAKWSMHTYKINLLQSINSYRAAKRLFQDERPDIVHLNSSSLCFVAWAAKSVDKTITVICHVREPLRKSLFGYLIKNICYHFVDKFIAIENFSAESMMTKGNISVIYNPVDLQLFNPLVKSDILRSDLGLSPDTIIFLFLARVAPGNGVLEFLEVAEKLQAINDKFKFIVVGFNENAKDSYSKSVRVKAQKISNSFLLAFRSDVAEVIASCDIMIIPFTEPHFARSGIEAAAMGKPCIGSDIGGVKECIIDGKTGFLYKNLEQCQQLCLELGSNKEKRSHIGQQAFNYASANFDSKKSAEKVFNTYD